MSWLNPSTPTDLVTIDELTISSMWEIVARVELLERKDVLSKQEVLEMIRELPRREPTAIPPGRYET